MIFQPLFLRKMRCYLVQLVVVCCTNKGQFGRSSTNSTINFHSLQKRTKNKKKIRTPFLWVFKALFFRKINHNYHFLFGKKKPKYKMNSRNACNYEIYLISEDWAKVILIKWYVAAATKLMQTLVISKKKFHSIATYRWNRITAVGKHKIVNNNNNKKRRSNGQVFG